VDSRDRPSQIGRAASYFALFSEIGFVLAIPILIGVLAGDRLDRSIGTWPIFLLVGSFAGMAFGGYASYRLITRFLERFESGPRGAGDRRDGAGDSE
jgi:F0F1-type ATP synthase assembly protein I